MRWMAPERSVKETSRRSARRPGRGPLQKRLELLAVEFAVAKNLGQQTGSDDLTCMDWHYGHSTVWVAEEMVATLHPYYFEPNLPQSRDDVLPG